MDKIEDMIVISFFVDQESTLSSKIHIPEHITLEMISSASECISSISCPNVFAEVVSAIKERMLKDPTKLKDCLQILNSCNVHTDADANQPEKVDLKPCVLPRDVLDTKKRK